jgi:orotate phosphoribosyltransferase/orotidine-5'-phosphate decarboxylase
MNIKEKVAKALLEVEAVRLNVGEPFTFVSGIKSPIYCDNRRVIGFPEERNVIVDAFIEALKDKDYDILAGTATAGIPWAAFIAEKLNKPMAYIRSKPKAHGAGKQIEGGDVEGKKIIIIEDLVSTGGSCISALEAARKEGAKEVEVMAIFSYEFQKAYDRFKEANCKWETLSSFPHLIDLAEKENYLSTEDAKEAKEWNKSPDTWKK